MGYHYSNPNREIDRWSLPDIEVMDLTTPEAIQVTGDSDATGGFFYWFCYPGCLPDSDAIGPFSKYEEALAAARFEFDIDFDDTVAELH